MRQRSRPSPLLLLPMLLLPACDYSIGGDEYDPPAATILRVDVEPDPVAVGDTATFTVVIAESTAAGLRFEWIPPGIRGSGITSENRFLWKATEPPGSYRLTVEVDRRSGAFEPVQGSVNFTIIATN